MDKFRDLTEVQIDLIEEISDGRQHNTARVQSVNGQNFFLKYGNSIENISRIKHSLGALENMRGVRIDDFCPKIIESYCDNNFAYILYEYYPHSNMNWNDKNSVINLVNSCSSFLSEIHSCDTFENQESWDRSYSRSYQSFLNNFRDSTIDLLDNGEGKYEQQIESSISALQSDDANLQICFGDFHLPNIRLNENGTIRKVVDWDRVSVLDISYELAKTEARIFDLYSHLTPFDRNSIIEQFRNQYGVSENLNSRIQHYKKIYTIRTWKKMQQKSVFDTWLRVGSADECSDRYGVLVEELL